MFCYIQGDPASVFALKIDDVMAQTRALVVIKNEPPVITLQDYVVTKKQGSESEQ